MSERLDVIPAQFRIIVTRRAGHDTGAENWATIASLIETCQLNAVDPFAYLSATLTAIVNGHRQNRIEELMPWNYPDRQTAEA
ncbi:hypothetical protein A6U91_18640 [Agrobacterium tumefaciens]|uniref:Transposase IS66 C-terminal domain-containing protein n=1 Tax=Agrobacterium tumefaciens TaxID=358 RepID=A0AB36EMT9_AGRTU|nr:hypothetical protein A6U91_18640 [Agrobacterium tumefaciens]